MSKSTNCFQPIHPDNSSPSNKQWPSAIANHGNLLPLTKDATPEENNNHISRFSSSTEENDFFTIDSRSLTELVKDKNFDQLRMFDAIHGVASALKTDIDDGICGRDEDIARQRQTFGSNTYEQPSSKSFFHFVVEAFKDLTVVILLCCGALSIAFGIIQHGLKEGWYEGGPIFLAVFIVISVSAVSNRRQARQFEKLSKFKDNIQIQVVRNSRRRQISIFKIVIGYVTGLKIGDQDTADGLFLDGQPLQVDKSRMTGESDYVEINSNQNPFMFSGTKIVDGFAPMIATSVRMNTTWDQMMSQISRDTGTQKTILQALLNKLTSSMGKIGLPVALLVFGVMLACYFIGNTTDVDGNREFNGSKTNIGDVVNVVIGIVAAAVNIVAVAIPEYLPLAATISLACSMGRMMADQAMVRKLSASETMGSATVICTNKTGILTLNQVKATKFWLGQELIEEVTASSVSSLIIELIRHGVTLNITGSVYRATLGSEFKFSSSPTERAILAWSAQDLSMEMEEMKQPWTILPIEAFNLQKKRSGVMMRKKIDSTVNVQRRGAAEIILAMCSSYYDASGNMMKLDDGEKNTFEQIAQGITTSNFFRLAFARKQVQNEEVGAKDQKKLPEDSLSLVALVGIKDPCRPEVKKAVEDCQYAGVNIKMITGDNFFTAKAIATECGILELNHDMVIGAVVEGREFRSYTAEEKKEKVENIFVMARSFREDKLLTVKCLKEKVNVVAVTGDGTNDAPTLTEADIGLSMGIHGSEVAYESSDILMMDDNFASVVTVLEWGRRVYTRIQKFIQIPVTANIVAVLINIVAAVFSDEIPSTEVQLWVNLIRDTLGTLTLATGQPTKELIEKPPFGRNEPLITNITWRNIFGQACHQMIVLLILQFRDKSMFGVCKKVKQTSMVYTFVICQLFNEFNDRKLEKKIIFRGIGKNKLFWGFITITVILQMVMMQFLPKFANKMKLCWDQWHMY